MNCSTFKSWSSTCNFSFCIKTLSSSSVKIKEEVAEMFKRPFWRFGGHFGFYYSKKLFGMNIAYLRLVFTFQRELISVVGKVSRKEFDLRVWKTFYKFAFDMRRVHKKRNQSSQNNRYFWFRIFDFKNYPAQAVIG